MDDMNQIDRDRECLIGSRDAETGQVYFPQRAYAADGSMRETEQVPLSNQGVLYSWTILGDEHFGQIDLPERVRIQSRLQPSEHQIGEVYELVIIGEADNDWRFSRA